MADRGLKITVLGSGTSSGVPLIGCLCSVCRSKDPKNRRLRASLWITKKSSKTTQSLLIDTSTDLRQQALKHRIFQLDAILYTHPHADHVGGIDELRAWNFLQKGRSIPAFGNRWTVDELKTRFGYVFDPDYSKKSGTAVPKVSLSLIPEKADRFEVLPGLQIQPLPVDHGSDQTLGYRLDRFAYLTDCSYIPPSTLRKMDGLEVLILDCVRIKSHATHFNVEQALDTVQQLGPKKTFLTHLGHDFDYNNWNRKLPKGVKLAFDGLTVQMGENSL